MFFLKKGICTVKDYNLFYGNLNLMTLRYRETYIKETFEGKFWVKPRYYIYNFLPFV